MRLKRPTMGEEEATATAVVLRAVLRKSVLVEHDEVLVRHALESIEQAPVVDPARERHAGVRHTDPETSREAAKQVTPRAGSQRGRILLAYSAMHPRGMTSAEAAARFDLKGCYWKRIGELEEQGWLQVTGEKRTNPLSRTAQQEYVITRAGLEWAGKQERAMAAAL